MPIKPSIVLGINAGNGESSAALIEDGHLVAAAEEERFTRVKHYALFPTYAVEYCLRKAKIDPKDVEVVAVPGRPWRVFREKLALSLRHPQILRSGANRKARKEPSLNQMLKRCGLKMARVVHVEHHLAHLMSARFLSQTENPAMLCIDGLGDLTTAAIGRATENGVEILDRVHFPHSLGYFYAAMTHYLGFTNYGDESKVMDMSGCGQPRFLNGLQDAIRENEPFGFTLNLEAFPLLKNAMCFSIEENQPIVYPFYNKSFLTQLIGQPPRKPGDPISQAHFDLAKSVQLRFEEIATQLLTQLHAKVGGKTLALAGSCAHNTVWVGKIPMISPYKRVVVAPASHDAGLAIGAGAWASQEKIRTDEPHWALLGPSHEDLGPQAAASFPFEFQERSFNTEESLITWMANELSQKKIIGLFRGRMEFGPRALGNRSVLADPRFAETKTRINERIKHRESFRAVPASVQLEHQENWFLNSFFSPAMEATFEIREPARSRIPVVCHADNTCRVQSVSRELQPFFWNLIEAFRRKTGIPILANTSFNDAEPIVCSEKDAFDCFTNADLDHMVIGNRVISRVRAQVALTA